MINDSKVVDLAAWKQRKEDEELQALRERVEELLEEHAEELEPKMYPSVFHDDAAGTIDWLASLNPYNYNYEPSGIVSHADIVLEPNVESVSKTLAWVSYILSDMGMKDASDMVEEVIRSIESDNA